MITHRSVRQLALEYTGHAAEGRTPPPPRQHPSGGPLLTTLYGPDAISAHNTQYHTHDQE